MPNPTGVKNATGILLIQLGTPDAPRTREVRRYLREFLSDPRVLDMPALGRALLLYGAILPFRSPRSAKAYQKVWTEAGSPLLVHSRALTDGVAKELGDGFLVELGMRYGEPSLEGALDRLASAEVERIIVLPLFPHEAGSSSGSALQRTFELAGKRWDPPALSTLGPFYDDPGFIGAAAEIAGPLLEEFAPDHVLLSYHGLPERQVRRSDATGGHCLASDTCCDAMGEANRHCYRAQCYATSRALTAALGLDADRVSTSFQSRLGRTPWIQPFTDHRLPELAADGVRRLAVLCPSFVADCLETVEEIGIRGLAQWRELGGDDLLLVPCVNAQPSWVRSVAEKLRGAAQLGL
ncbi:MAG: ferrochelatase [Deltaproteobacteria bacterium]|nr:ferrochelatase [Deltaproteobacteria bacterium]MBW2396036.1 ferrochelatase [Deltaproteobacteria bacterium]